MNGPCPYEPELGREETRKEVANKSMMSQGGKDTSGQVGIEHLPKEVTLELKLEGPEGISQAKKWEIVPGRR